HARGDFRRGRERRRASARAGGRMSSPIWIVCMKEILETARDRRTLFSLVIGPLIGPLLFVALMNVMVSQTLSSAEDRLDVPMLGAERAPNLVAYFRARDIHPLAVPEIGSVDA